MSEVVLVMMTAPDEPVADRLAQALVEEQLAACVTMMPGVRSVYRWQGSVERAEEVQLLVKTTRGGLPALVKRAAQLHPYEVPEVIAVEVAGGLEAYLGWVIDSVSGS